MRTKDTFKIDYLYKEIANKNGEICGKKRETVQKELIKLEDELHRILKYPDEFHILRNKNEEKADYLINFEIKELVLLLLNNELNNPLARSNVSNSEVNKGNLEKIKGLYEDIRVKVDSCDEFNKKIISHNIRLDSAINTVEDFNEFNKALSNFITVVSQKYNNTAGDFIKDITEQLNAWTYSIIDNSENVEYCKKNNVKIINQSNDYSEATHKTTTGINIKIPLIRSISAIIECFYEFKKFSLARRSLKEVVEIFYKGKDKKDVIKEAESLWNRYMVLEDGVYCERKFYSKEEVEVVRKDLLKFYKKIIKNFDMSYLSDGTLNVGASRAKHKEIEDLKSFLNSLSYDKEKSLDEINNSKELQIKKEKLAKILFQILTKYYKLGGMYYLDRNLSLKREVIGNYKLWFCNFDRVLKHYESAYVIKQYNNVFNCPNFNQMAHDIVKEYFEHEIKLKKYYDEIKYEIDNEGYLFKDYETIQELSENIVTKSLGIIYRDSEKCF